MDEIPGRLHELDRTVPVAVICRSGNRSADVTNYLKRLGYEASNVDGGLRQWIRDGLPLHT
jgi:rhodanese-related sulfurtransferase